MIAHRRGGLARMSSRSAMTSRSRASSVASFSDSRAVRRRSGISRMALAWISESSNRSARRERASGVLAEERITAITSVM